MNDDPVAASEAAKRSAAAHGNSTILAATKGSPRCQEALDWAAAEAGARGSSLRIVHSVGWPPMTADALGALPVDRLAAITAAGESILDDATSRARSIAPGLDVVGELEFDRDAAAAIVRAAKSDALIVLGRQRDEHQRFRRFGHSTAARVARHAPCPVAVIGLFDGMERPGAGRVTAVLDSRAESLQALDFAIQAAERRGVDVVVLRVGDRASREFEAALSQRARTGPRSVWLHDRWCASPGALLAEAAGAALVVVSDEASRPIRRAFFGRVGRPARRGVLGPVVLVRKGP